MKLTHRLVVRTLAVALALPIAAFAAKGDRKKQSTETAPAFASVDKDSNGSISESEFVAANENLGATAAKARFGILDKNHDGKLSKEEYAAGSEPEKKKGRKKKDQE